MNLSIRLSRQSLSSCSSNSRSMGGSNPLDLKGLVIPGALESRSQSETVEKENKSSSLPKIQGLTTSNAMSKSNRISLADAIQIKEMEILKEI